MQLNNFLDIKSKNVKYGRPLSLVKSTNKIDIPILYINLQRSVERNENMLAEFKYYGITNYTRIDAFDFKNLKFPTGSIDFLNYKVKKTGNLSVYGCSFSHIKAIKYAYDNDLEYALILEDDCQFFMMDYWKHKKLSHFFNDAPEDWEILQLFSLRNNNTDASYPYKYIKSFGGSCAVAYVINRKGMTKFMDLLNKFNKNGIHDFTKINLIIDIFLYNSLNSYFISPIVLSHSIYCFKQKSTLDPTSEHDRRTMKRLYDIFDKNIQFITDFIISNPVIDFNVKCDSVFSSYEKSQTWFYLYGQTAYDLENFGIIRNTSISICFDKYMINQTKKVTWNNHTLNIFNQTKKPKLKPDRKTVWIYKKNLIEHDNTETPDVIKLHDKNILLISRYINPNFDKIQPFESKLEYIMASILYEFGGKFLYGPFFRKNDDEMLKLKLKYENFKYLINN